MQDFAAFVCEQAKNIATKRLQPDQPYKNFWSSHKQKNPGSAATETGIKSIAKASSFLRDLTRKSGAKSTDNPVGRTLPGGAL